MRIALVYDCLHPPSGGGAERWLRALAGDLARDHEVTYLTRRQWEPGAAPLPGVRCVAVAPGGPLETDAGRRRLIPPLLFGAGVFAHLARHRADYDLVHCLSFPYTSVPAARLALLRGGPALVVEWLECLSPGWWRAYAGPVAPVGLLAQRIAIGATPAAVCFSAHTERHLRAAGLRAPVTRLGGLWEEEHVPDGGVPANPFLLFAGRHVPDKGVLAVPGALALLREAHPELRAVIAGDGPLHTRAIDETERLGLTGALDVRGFVARDELLRLLAGAACLVVPSRRDGHGMTAVEAIALGTPVVAASTPDSAVTELVAEGVNGAVAASAEPRDLAAAVERVLSGGGALRASTREWWAANRDELSAATSIAKLRDVHAAAASAASRARRA